MQLRRITPKEEWLSTPDQELVFAQPHVYAHPGGNAAFTLGQLPGLEEVEPVLPERVFKELLGHLGGVTKGLITYKSAEGLQVYFHETDLYYTIISAGEYQPGLYKVFIEGVFEKQGIENGE
jgi:hypothetical protein